MAIDIGEAALIMVDVQNDFCPAYTGKDGKQRPDGALAVSRGYEVIEPLNHYHNSFASSHPGKKVNEIILLPVPESVQNPGIHRQDPIQEYALPAIQQVMWPDHCIQGSEGAQFHDELNLDYVNLVIRKGDRGNLDSYSVFFENDRYTSTGLDGFLKGLDIKQIFIGGLATDYCVLYSAMDAVRLGYSVVVLSDAVCGVNVPEGSVKQATSLMRGAGISFVTTQEILG
jgi:nicotinamidase/pyrazinamidase